MQTRVITIDCQYLFPRFAAAYLIVSQERAVLVDNNTAHSVPLIMDALKNEGLTAESVDFLIVTHVHLDHAGGSSALMNLCPNARILAHPKAARHLIDPSKLVASARKVYGDEQFERLYGRIDPIDASRVQVVEDNARVSWQGAEFLFLHTRGHANHHTCILMSEGGHPKSIFTGDSFGLIYPDLQKAGLFAIPSTSPTDFDPGEARTAFQRIVNSGAQVAYPTHFGPVSKIQETATQLREEIDFSEALLNEAIASPLPDDRLEGFCEEKINRRIPELFEKRGMSWDEHARELLKLDMELNAAGIAHIAKKRRSERRSN